MPSKKKTKKTTDAARIPEPSEAARAFALVADRLTAVAEHELRPFNVNLGTAVSIALAADARLAPLRNNIAELPGLPTEPVPAA